MSNGCNRADFEKARMKLTFGSFTRSRARNQVLGSRHEAVLRIFAHQTREAFVPTRQGNGMKKWHSK